MAGHRRDPEGFDPLEAALDELRALEVRIRGVEDALTSGDAQTLPAPPRTGRARDPDLQLMELALAISGLARRMNVRLGAIERALEGRGAVGLADMSEVRGRRRLHVRAPARPRSRPLASLGADVQIRIVKDDPPTRPN
jgi:hypothetical protein